PWTAYVLTLLLAGCAVLGFRVWQHSHDRAAGAAGLAPVVPISSARAYWVDPQYLAVYQGQLATYLAAQPGKYAVATIDVTTDAGVGINQDLPFRAASVNKLELAISLYRRALSHQINLDATTEIADDEIQNYGTGTIQLQGDGRTFTYRALARLMLEESDNTASFCHWQTCRSRFSSKRPAVLGSEADVDVGQSHDRARRGALDSSSATPRATARTTDV
ncbi:MAG TPA: serine hydrolase, partial [Dehalococcoidia bacterium]